MPHDLTGGLSKPQDLFLDDPAIQHVLGDCVPYLKLPNKAVNSSMFPKDMGIVTELSSSSVLSALRLLSAEVNGAQDARKDAPRKEASFSCRRAALIYAALSRFMTATGADSPESIEVRKEGRSFRIPSL